jgi:hypothetical protein
VNEFEYVKDRVNTREGSTLAFSTVTVSVSVVFLAILISKEGSMLSSLILGNTLVLESVLTPNFWPWLIGITITSFGILYREVTIFGIDMNDYRILRKYVTIPPAPKRMVVLRGILVRAFFYLTFSSWIIYYSDYWISYTGSAYILCLHIFTLVIVFIVSTVVSCIEYRKRNC